MSEQGKKMEPAAPSTSTSTAMSYPIHISQSKKSEQEEWNMKAKVLNRKKDFLHFILSYPMKPEVEVDIDSLKMTLFHANKQLFRVNQQLREQEVVLAQEFNKDKSKFVGKIEDYVTRLLSDVEGSLGKSAFDILAYLPQDMVDNMLLPSEEATRKDEMVPIPQVISNLAIEFAMRQISKCIKEGKIKRIGISGSHAEEVAEALKDLPEIKGMFDVLVCITVARHHNIKEIEMEFVQQINEFHRTATPKAPIGDFLLLLNCEDKLWDLHELKILGEGCIMVTSRSYSVYQIMDVDLEIRTKDHFLPWELFYKIVGQKPSTLQVQDIAQDIAVHLIKGSGSHLLAVVLLATALKDENDVGVWKVALHQLTKQSSSLVEGVSEVMVAVLSFIWGRKDIHTKDCIQYYASRLQGAKFQKPLLLNHWIAHCLIEDQEKGEGILEDLVNSFLLLENASKDSVRMREEPILALLNLFRAGLGTLNSKEVEEWNEEEIKLTNNELTQLPEMPVCPNLTRLSLEQSTGLMVIPTTFFERMPALQDLNLSKTSIQSLPKSISKLVPLRKFWLKSCPLLMELPPEIGNLVNLREFDLEGTELICLPKEIGKLINLSCLKMSLYGYANQCKDSNQIDAIIPRNSLSKLSRLEELSINVKPEGEWWDEEVKAIIEELSSLENLTTVNLYLPTVEVLQQFQQLKIYPSLSKFRLTVGRHGQHIMSRLPEKLEELFKSYGRGLKYINGKEKNEITKTLKRSNAFFLERHWTLKKLSEFDIDETNELKFCLLFECNEILTIIDGEEFYSEDPHDEDGSNDPTLTKLERLYILYMKNLESIWKGPIDGGCLASLKYLAIHTCPCLTTIFTLALIDELVNLKELTVEDCPKIQSLVNLDHESLKSKRSDPRHFLPSLNKITLVDLPELISMFSGRSIAAGLERVIIYNCPKLETLSDSEVSLNNLKVITGEREWWDAVKQHNLKGSSSRPDDLDSIFVPLRMDGDLMAQLTEDPAEEMSREVVKPIRSGNEKKRSICESSGRSINIEIEVLMRGNDYLHLLGRKISLQLISGDRVDPGNEFQSKVGQEEFFTERNAHFDKKLSGMFDWNEMGAPGAFIMKNYYDKDFYLKTLTVEDIPGHGRIHIICNSWIWATHKQDHIFFLNKTYIPSKTPAPLHHYRKEDLRNLRGDGTDMLGTGDLIYDYAYYDDLGDPDKGVKYVRPVLGGSVEYPYPRRRRTCRLPTKTDPVSISGLDNYAPIPNAERFVDPDFASELLYDAEKYINSLLSRLDTPQGNTLNDFNMSMHELYGEYHRRFEYGMPRMNELEQFRAFERAVEGLNNFSSNTDKEFVRKILTGVSPVTISLLQDFPPTSKLDPKVYGNQISSISKSHIKTNLDGLTLEEAMEDKRLYILDHHDTVMPYLRQMNATSTRTYATRSIFFLQSNRTLKPLAIELSLPHPKGDQFGAISKVCTPDTSVRPTLWRLVLSFSGEDSGRQGFIWGLAKAYVEVNDSGYQLISHWLNSNAVIEPFVIATNRQLSVLHPIYKLLHLHFHDVIQTNAFARKMLLNADGALEKTFSLAKFGMEMSASAYKNWVFPDQALPVDLIKRGMAVKDSNSPHGVHLLVEGYPYADDGLEIWSAIKTWVEDYCNFYYKDDDMIQTDSELQFWWKELREVGHGDKKDEPWWPRMQTLKELIDTCTIIIWVASGLHAVINFRLFDPSYPEKFRPTISHQFMPAPGTCEYAELKSNPEKAFFKTFNTPKQVILADFLTNLLCRQFSSEVYLGQFDTRAWKTDTEPLQAFERFRIKVHKYITKRQFY